MSIRLMTLVWDIDFPTQAQKLIALRLADYAADTGGSVYPARETLAKACGCDESTIKRTLKAFRDCGLLHLIREGGNGPKDTNEWLLDVALMRALAEGKCQIVGGAKALEIEGETPAEAVDNKGGMVPPLESTRGASEPLRGSFGPDKGVTSAPQSTTKNHHIETPLRAHAREGSISDFKSERDRKAWLKIMSDRIKWAMDGPSLTRTWSEIKLVEAELGPEAFGLLKEAANGRLAELKARDDQRREAGERRFP